MWREVWASGAGVGFAACWLGACSSEPLPVIGADAGDERVGHVTFDAEVSPSDAGARLTPHDGVILPYVQLGVVYVGDVDAGVGAQLDWLVGSPYWGLLDEYGVGAGAITGSARVATSTLLAPGDVDPTTGLVDMSVLDHRIATLLHGDADAGTAPSLIIPGAQAYLLYLPDGVNVALGQRGSYTFQTCIDANGYHAFDGFEPYAVLPPCPVGRSLYAAAHELSEVATDPQPYHGWVSDVDIAKTGGEVADLCPEQVMQEGVYVSRLWSNVQSRCVP